jgi:hypothetical protein
MAFVNRSIVAEREREHGDQGEHGVEAKLAETVADVGGIAIHEALRGYTPREGNGYASRGRVARVAADNGAVGVRTVRLKSRAQTLGIQADSEFRENTSEASPGSWPVVRVACPEYAPLGQSNSGRQGNGFRALYESATTRPLAQINATVIHAALLAAPRPRNGLVEIEAKMGFSRPRHNPRRRSADRRSGRRRRLWNSAALRH